MHHYYTQEDIDRVGEYHHVPENRIYDLHSLPFSPRPTFCGFSSKQRDFITPHIDLLPT